MRRGVTLGSGVGVVPRWGVVAARIEGVTARNAFHREPATAPRAVRREAGDRIMGAGGLKSTSRPEQRGEHALIDPDHKYQ